MNIKTYNPAADFNILKYDFNKLPLKLTIALKQDLRNIKSITPMEHYDRIKLVDNQDFKIMKDLTRLFLILLTCEENTDESVSEKDLKENRVMYLKHRVKIIGTPDLTTIQHIIEKELFHYNKN